ncbi:hypothetical protein [Odoribacter laneus]|uniref:hypothetical protein n=1 Tax=Odoribacter laneus TaxID=626933 RepID=UPI00265ACF7C|nr:hypothetical protein [Odoribacter laneus]
MKIIFYIILVSTILFSSCSSTRSLNSTIEDDIYFVPGSKPLMMQEVENITGQNIPLSSGNRQHAPASGNFTTENSAVIINRQQGTTEEITTGSLTSRAQQRLAESEEVNEVLYENTGYWIGGFKGSDSDLREAARIIARYPDGFGYIANGEEIALNLSFSPDWNVYTDNGRYWWFPSYTNVKLYSSLLFGTYPQYIWTVVWDNPSYDVIAFDSQFNFGLNIGWGSPGWSFGLGWNSGFYRPWYNGWYNPYWSGWYDPWWGYYPGWGHPHWHHPPHWGGGNHPGWNPPAQRPGNLRPNYGGGSIGLRPNHRPGTSTRPNVTGRPNTSINRPNVTTRPEGIQNRPNYSTSRPSTGVNVRPSTGTSTRPSVTTRPGTTRPTNNISRPTNKYTRPGNSSTGTNRYTRPSNSSTGTNRYTRPNVRPNTNNSINRSTTRTYNRSYNNYRPSYNSNRSTSPSRSSGSYQRTPTRSTSVSPSRSTGTNRSVSPSRSTQRSGGRR